MPADGAIRDSPQELARLDHLCGRNPQVMSLLCSYSVPADLTGIRAVEAAYEAHGRDMNHDLGGLRMRSDLRQFTVGISHPLMLRWHVELLAQTIRGGVVVADPAMYDARYFVRTDGGLLPVCGFAAEYIAEILQTLLRDRLPSATAPAPDGDLTTFFALR